MKYDPTALEKTAGSVDAAAYECDRAIDTIPDGWALYGFTDKDVNRLAGAPDQPDEPPADYDPSYAIFLARPLAKPYEAMMGNLVDALSSTAEEMNYFGACLRRMAKNVKNAEDANIGDIKTIEKLLEASD
ncbi:hypothetical protein GCM10023191_053980 [Actinoallomurus oryzae]|jgi:hypothetical protein|uniref:Uncharacterized protein n=1 Tax=Actinoallomurus oryzae TaxID=502180 RepID=A0ABP8QHZ0_9ACTN